MHTLTLSDAIALVRKNLDEVEPNGSVMYDDENMDNMSVDDIIAKNLPEAINAVNLAAPVHLLEGYQYSYSPMSAIDGITGKVYEDKLSISSDGVLYLELQKTSVMRLLAFRAEDSDVVVTEVYPESSPEGRKQLNKYIRGRADSPRMISLQGYPETRFKYYSITDPGKYSEDISKAIALCKYVKREFYAEDRMSYDVSEPVLQNIIDYLTAIVLETYGSQRAEFFFNKASIYSR